MRSSVQQEGPPGTCRGRQRNRCRGSRRSRYDDIEHCTRSVGTALHDRVSSVYCTWPVRGIEPSAEKFVPLILSSTLSLPPPQSTTSSRGRDCVSFTRKASRWAAFGMIPASTRAPARPSLFTYMRMTMSRSERRLSSGRRQSRTERLKESQS